jgi:hypothetical protein
MTYAYYNFRTKEDEQRDPPEDWSDYISQDFASQNLYKLYIEMGDSPADAAIKVLSQFAQASQITPPPTATE